MTFPEQDQPLISTPEQLLARGDMPQIPYEKTSRVPEGFDELEAHLVAYLNEMLPGHLEHQITPGMLTLHAAKVRWLVDDPDVPREAKDRTALFSVALTEGAEPTFWLWAYQEPSGVLVASDFTDEAEARAAYANATTDE